MLASKPATESLSSLTQLWSTLWTNGVTAWLWCDDAWSDGRMVAVWLWCEDEGGCACGSV